MQRHITGGTAAPRRADRRMGAGEGEQGCREIAARHAFDRDVGMSPRGARRQRQHGAAIERRGVEQFLEARAAMRRDVVAQEAQSAREFVERHGAEPREVFRHLQIAGREAQGCGALKPVGRAPARVEVQREYFAEALGLPSLWIKATDGVAGDGFKFRDWFTTTLHPQSAPLLLEGSEQPEQLARQAEPRGLTVSLHGLPSPYWGQDQVVTGLLTGSDLRQGLADKDLGDCLLLPRVMLRQGEDVFLDDTTLEALQQALPVPIQLLGGADDLVACCLGSRQERV